jgi:hypothetical protein
MSFGVGTENPAEAIPDFLIKYYQREPKGGRAMIIDLNPKEKELLITELEKNIIPELRGEITSGGRKAFRDVLKKDEEVFKEILNKLKMAA